MHVYMYTNFPPVRTVVLQASLAVYCLARSCGMKKMDLPDDMQAVSQQPNTEKHINQPQLQYYITC